MSTVLDLNGTIEHSNKVLGENCHRESALHPFGLRVRGADLARLPDDELRGILALGLAQHGLLAFPRQHLCHRDLVRITSAAGQPLRAEPAAYRVPGFPSLTIVSNIREGGKLVGVYDGDDEEEWHCDHSYCEHIPSVSLLYSVASARVGGETRFANTTVTFQELGCQTRRRAESLRALHSLKHLDALQRGTVGEKLALAAHEAELSAWHDLVVTSRFSEKKALLLGKSVIARLTAGSCHQDGSRQFVSHLEHLCTEPEKVYEHHWCDGDLLVWDNLAILHSASPCDSSSNRRLLYRALAL